LTITPIKAYKLAMYVDRCVVTRLSRAFLAVSLGVALSLKSAAQEKKPSSSASELTTVEQDKTSLVENSVVKVFSTMRYPDTTKPWTKQAPSEYTGSGVVIEGKRILSNAHLVEYASQVEVQANQGGDKLSATVECLAPEIDLAILKIDDEAFFESHPALQMAQGLPKKQDVVMAYGYPKGGSSLSITKGIVSRIEFTSYGYAFQGLRIQIDAAINPGNSGGPAVVGDKMIGLAMGSLGSAQNIGYIIPSEEIELFLHSIVNGRYQGKASIFDELQTLENPALRAFLKLNRSVEGMVVHKPDRNEANYPLKEWDVITHIGDTAIDDQGMIKLDTNLRVAFPYLVQKIARGDKVPLTIVRNGQELKVELPIGKRRPRLIPDLVGDYPSYFVYGPMVFSSATTQFITALGRTTKTPAAIMTALVLTRSPLVSRMMEEPAFDGESLVVVSSPFFPHKLSTGYSNPMGQVVKAINGTKVRNLPHLVELLRDAKEEFLEVEFDSRGTETLVFRRNEMLAATDEILTDNGVRAQGSSDALAVWKARKE
jgi:S1-C subfamily serine protease